MTKCICGKETTNKKYCSKQCVGKGMVGDENPMKKKNIKDKHMKSIHTEEYKVKRSNSLKKSWTEDRKKETSKRVSLFWSIDENRRLSGERIKNTLNKPEVKCKLGSGLRGKKRPEHSKIMSGKNNPMYGVERFDMRGDNNWMRKPEHRERARKIALDGLAAYASSCNKNPSKPQVELFELVKQLCFCAQLNYYIKEVNKVIDIAIPFHKIAIEYDGSYWHQDEEKDIQRQKQIESLGWRFIRYIDRIPSLEELISSIKE